MSRILLANHESTTTKIMTKLLRTEGYKVVTADNSSEAKDLLGSDDFSLVIAGIGKDIEAETDLVSMVKELPTHVPVVVLMERDEAVAAKVAELSPFETIEKPLKIDKLLAAVQGAVDYHDTSLAENVNLNLQLETCYQFENVVAESPAMKSVCDMVSRIAATDVTVVITGEGGTGKSVIARAVHDSSRRSDKEFVSLNCESGAGSLGSDLFGQDSTAGALERAAGGTLFLREVVHLPAATQQALAVALKSRAFKRLGGSDEIAVDMRLVASASTDLAADVEAGAFDENLYNLIKIILVKIPPLRDRTQDIMPTVRRMLQIVVGAGKVLPPLDAEVTGLLEQYNWPDNVSEMEVILKEALGKLQDGKIVKASLPASITG